MKAYIAGPMSGYPKFNIPAFDWAAKELRRKGWDIVSPAEVDGPEVRSVYLQSVDGDHVGLEEKEQPYEFYLERDLEIIRTGGFDFIVTLPGWEKSPGANREVGFALGLGIPRLDFAEAFNTTVTKRAEPALLSGPNGFEWHEDNPLRQRQATGGVKDNLGKSRVDLIPSKPLIAVGHVLAIGAKKYKPNNWRLGLRWSDTLGSIQRHLLAFADGEDLDPETGLPHIDQALCQTLFLSEYYHSNTGIDDRWSSLPEADREAAKA